MKQSLQTENFDHRSYAPPATPSAVGQVWSELLFAHWPVSPADLRPLLPLGLELDTFEGQAWVGVVPFLMSNVRLFGLPPVPYASRFAELNVRTYVIKDGRPGVYFFSLDANNLPAVTAARSWYHLPYFRAKMSVEVGETQVHYVSRRNHRNYPAGEFEAVYGPSGEIFQTIPGTLEHWLTARYCLYAVDRRQNIYRGEIHHAPWPLQPAQAEIVTNSVAQSWGIPLPNVTPLLHYAKRLDVVAWSVKRLK